MCWAATSPGAPATWARPSSGATSPFTGNFNGFGHVINSFSPTAFTGLFGTIGTGGTVSNLGIPSPSTPSSAPYAAAAGMLANYNQGNVINSFVAPGSWSSSANVRHLRRSGRRQFRADRAKLCLRRYLYATNIAGWPGRHQRSVRQDHRQLYTEQRHQGQQHSPPPLALPTWAAW